MIININDEYRITSDPQNWVTQKLSVSKKGKAGWKNLGYYLSFKAAIVALSEYRIRKIDSAIPTEILAAIDSIKADAAKVAMEFTQTAV